MTTSNLKLLPRYTSDKDTERFVDEADFTEYDLSGLKPMTFEIESKDKNDSSN